LPRDRLAGGFLEEIGGLKTGVASAEGSGGLGLFAFHFDDAQDHEQINWAFFKAVTTTLSAASEPERAARGQRFG
jgi:hypothetical protein